MSKEWREHRERSVRRDCPELLEKIEVQIKQEKKELRIWTKHKNKLIQGRMCESCGKPAETMHHPKPRREYSSFEEYLNEPNLTPVCNWCHYTVYHKRNPYHMLWRKCRYRGNKGIRMLPEYKQKKIIYKEFCNQCSDKEQCLAIPTVTLYL